MRLAFLDLPDDRVDLISLALESPRVRIVFVAHSHPGALALKMAEALEIPRSTEPLDLLALKPDQVALPSHDTPSAAALSRAGISQRIFTTLDELAVRLTTAPAHDVNGEPETLEAWEVMPKQDAVPSTIRSIEDSLARSDDREGILREILAYAAERSGAEEGSIMFLDPEEGELWIAYAEGLSADTVQGTRRKLGEGIAGTVAQSGEPKITHDRVATGPGTRRRERARISSAISVPLIRNGRTFGVLNVSIEQPGKRFDSLDLKALTEAAEVTAPILDRLARTGVRDDDALELRALRAVERAFREEELPLRERWRAAATRLAEALGCVRATIFLGDADGQNLQWISSGTKVGAGGAIPFTEGLHARALRDGAPYFLMSRPVRASGADADPDVVTLQGVPIREEGVLGILEVEQIGPSSRDLESRTRFLTRIGRALASHARSSGNRGGRARHAELMAKLAEIAPRLIVPHDMTSLLAESLGALRVLFGEGLLAVRLRDGRGEIVLRSSFDGAEEARFPSIMLEQRLAERSLEEGLELSSSIESEAPRSGGSGSEILVVPVRSADRIVGTLAATIRAATREPAEPPDVGFADLDVIRRLAVYVALAWSHTGSDSAEPLSPNDPLTGLLGCQGLESRVLEEIKRVERYHDRFLLTFCSIPGLKRLQDRHGSEWADSLVREFGRALLKNVREVDAVARIGGGRFAVLSPETDKNGGALLKRLDQLLPHLEAVQARANPEEIRLVGRQYTYPDEIQTGGEILALIRSSYAPE